MTPRAAPRAVQGDGDRGREPGAGEPDADAAGPQRPRGPVPAVLLQHAHGHPGSGNVYPLRAHLHEQNSLFIFNVRAPVRLHEQNSFAYMHCEGSCIMQQIYNAIRESYALAQESTVL